MNGRLIAITLPALLWAGSSLAEEASSVNAELANESPAVVESPEPVESSEPKSSESIQHPNATSEVVAEPVEATESTTPAEDAVTAQADETPPAEPITPLESALPSTENIPVTENIPAAAAEPLTAVTPLPETPPETPAVIAPEAEAAATESSAEEREIVTKLAQLVSENKFTLAYELGQTHQAEWEGDGEFDFNFGVAAAQTQHFNEAIFAFERLLEEFPNNARFRLELARCHYFLNNLIVAEQEFKRVERQKPPEGVQKHIDRFLTRIAEQRQQIQPSWSGGLDIAAGHDSNINAATDLDAVQATFYIGETPLTGSLTLADEQKSTDSAYYQVQGYSQYQRPLTKRSNIDIAISGSHKDNTENNDYDLANAAVSGGIRFIRGAHNLRFGGVYRQYWLAGEDLQSQSLGNVRWQWLFAPKWKTGADFEAGHQNNDQNNALDFYQWQGKANITRISDGFSQNLQISYGADIALESENKYQGREHIGLGYQARQSLTESSQLYALLNYRDNSYQDAFDGQHPFYANKTRSDQLAQVIVGWTYSFNKYLGGKVQVNHSQNSSNLDLYEYDRTQLEAGVNVRF